MSWMSSGYYGHWVDSDKKITFAIFKSWSVLLTLLHFKKRSYLLQVLQELQRQYMSVKYGCTSLLSPASEHPLQDVDSPSPIRPLHTGSTSALYNPSAMVSRYMKVEKQILTANDNILLFNFRCKVDYLPSARVYIAQCPPLTQVFTINTNFIHFKYFFI